MPTPDRVQNVVVPSNGLLMVMYHAMFKNSVTTAGRAAIFVGANQLKGVFPGSPANPAVVEEPNGSANVDIYRPLFTSMAQDSLVIVSGATGYNGDVGTGQMVGDFNAAAGPLWIMVDPGTYDVSVQFKATSGSVTVKNRKLWVWTMGF